jgi:hypothetical protein
VPMDLIVTDTEVVRCQPAGHPAGKHGH